jgi:hypothetical protein
MVLNLVKNPTRNHRVNHCDSYRESLQVSTTEIVAHLVSLIGRKLTAYIGGVRDVRAVNRWMEGRELYGDVEQRLRFALQLVKVLAEKEDPKVIQAWLMSRNPELGDRVPVRLIRENDFEKVAPESWALPEPFSSVDRSKQMDLESKRPTGPHFRLERAKGTRAVLDCAYAKGGTFGKRFDDTSPLQHLVRVHAKSMRNVWIPGAGSKVISRSELL